MRMAIELGGEACNKAEHILAIARQSCVGLSEQELAAIESAKLSSGGFFHCLRGSPSTWEVINYAIWNC